MVECEVIQLHRKMGHTKFLLLVKQLMVAFPDRDSSVLTSVAGRMVCDACERRKRAANRPMVALPKEPHLNYEVGADLWYLRGYPVLHGICLFTRLRYCSVLTNKTATDVCHAFLRLWVKYCGPPMLLYTDLGKEFDNDLMRLFSECHGITLQCAPGGAHWWRSGVERHHYQLRHTAKLVLELDDTLSPQVACDVTCMFLNYHRMADCGFSPQQLVHGVCARWPDFVSANLPALSNTGVASDHVGRYMSHFLQNMYLAREKFHAVDVRAKISLAQQHRLSANRDLILAAGDIDFY